MYYHWEAELTSHLAFKKTDLPFNNLKELSQNSKFKLVVSKGSVFLDYFKYSDDPVTRQIWKDKLEPFEDQLPLGEEIEKTLLEDPYTVAYDESIMKLTPEYISCNIIDIRPPIRKNTASIRYKRKFPISPRIQASYNEIEANRIGSKIHQKLQNGRPNLQGL